MRRGLLGQIATPGSGHRVLPGVHWCADNAAFTGRFPGEDKYLTWLSARAAHAGWCAFATAPDVPFDAAATLARSLPMLERIRAAGYPVALVAQDGLEHLPISFDSFDVLFLGGSTAWKLGPAAADLAAQARTHQKSVHMGRVNSLTRLRYAASIGCHSADGTFLAYGPDRNLPTLLRWLSAIHTPHPTVPGAGCDAAASHSPATNLPPPPATAGEGNPVIDCAAPVHSTSPRSPLLVCELVSMSGDPTP